MLRTIATPLRRGIVAVLAVFCLPLIGAAGTINIILSGMGVTYSGGADSGAGSIYDVIAHPGGGFNPADADELQTAVFEVNMAPVLTLMSDASQKLYGDLKIDGVGPTMPLNVLNSNIGNNGGGFGFDWFTTSAAAGPYLKLGTDKVDVLLTSGVMFFTGNATVLSQNLPNGLAFDTSQPVVFSYTATLPGIMGNPASGAISSGALTISGTLAVPEPASFVLLYVGAWIFGIELLCRRGRRLATCTRMA